MQQNKRSVVSIFVNQTQFNDPSDFDNYPKPFQEDIEILKSKNVDLVFCPDYAEMYPDNYHYRVIENNFSKLLCGESRPGHFDGVLTVVMKLLQIIRPDKAYFGEKDYQQFKLIGDMCKAFFMDVEIIPGETVRENDGLAMSSRNLLLPAEHRKIAAKFPDLLKSENQPDVIQKKLEQLGFRVDYITDIGHRRFGAVYLGNVRLIDNVKL